MGAVHVEEVVVTVSALLGEVGTKVLEQLSGRFLDLLAALVVGVSEVVAVVAEAEAFAVRKEELVLREHSLDPARVLLRIPVVDGFS